jgi:ferredoxin-NADP reductase
VKVLTVQLEPEVQPGQCGLLLLNERKDDIHDPQPRRAYSIALPRQEHATGRFTVEVPQVQPGTYLVRVQIDGAESQLDPPARDGEPYAGPLVIIDE